VREGRLLRGVGRYRFSELRGRLTFASPSKENLTQRRGERKRRAEKKTYVLMLGLALVLGSACMGDEGVDMGTSLPSMTSVSVQGQADAVIGDAILRVVVGADFFGAVAGFDLAAALGGQGDAAFPFLVRRGVRGERACFGAIFDLDFSSCWETTSRWECA